MVIDFNHAKKVATGCLAMTSCAFLLWINQSSVHADAVSETPVVQVNNTAVVNNDQAQNQQPQINVQDQGNYANLDSVQVNNNQLEVSGWHATNQAVNKPNRFIIVYDQTANQEAARQEITEPVSRPDVQKVFPGVNGAGNSGFNIQLPLQKINLNHELSIVSRYSGSQDGNSDYVDYWFKPITVNNPANQGYLDEFNLSDGQHLVVSGWHATDLAALENNHFAIIYDQTSHSQVACVPTAVATRDDVAKTFPNIKGAAQAGFTGTFDLSKIKLIPGHHYSVVSRYSTSSEGNGDNGQYTDFWSAPIILNQQASSWIDNIKMTNAGLKVAGWMISDQSINHPYAYVIVLNNGKEVNRAAVQLVSRPDVAKIYSNVYNSANSGFNTLVKFNPAAITGNLQVILRFTDDQAGNGNFVDQYSQVYPSNAGNFDAIQVNGNNLYVSGWHASNQAVNKPYEYLIFLNQNGQELYRQQVLDINRDRPDVANVFPAIYNSERSGYQLGFQMPANMQKQLVTVIHRFTDDKAGNGNFIDYRSDPISLSQMRTPIDYRMPSEYAPYPDVSKLHNFWIHVRIGQNRVYMMDSNNVVYTMYCTAGRYVNGVSLTPTGTYYVQNERGDVFDYGEHWTSWKDHGVYLFHSVVFDAPWHDGYYDQEQLKLLGVSAGSHGCIRLPIPDANWIQHNVPAGTRVVIEN